MNPVNLPRILSPVLALAITVAAPFGASQFVGNSQPAPEPSLHQRIAAQLEQFEGYSPEAYMDTLGHLTIGFGHKLSAEYISHAPVDRDQAREMLSRDILEAESGALRVFPNLFRYPEPAQEALIHMAFQLGTTGLSRFVNLKKALSLNPPNYTLAAVECIHSRWCQQTPVRARFCAALFGSIK